VLLLLLLLREGIRKFCAPTVTVAAFLSRWMPFRNQRSISFVEKGDQKRSRDPCALYSVRNLPDSAQTRTYSVLNKSALPRSFSDTTGHKVPVAYCALHSCAGGTIPLRASPLPFYAGSLKEVAKPRPPPKSKRVRAEQRRRRSLKLATISSPQPLDLHGIPNGLQDIVPKSEEHAVQRRQKHSSPLASEEKAKKTRRRGLVLDGASEPAVCSSITVSGPVLISHSAPQASDDNVIDMSQLKLRSSEEQTRLTKQFASTENLALCGDSENGDSSPPKSKSKAKSAKANKPKPKAVQQLKDGDYYSRSSGSASGRMADKIQRTIRALYDSNTTRRRSFERLTDDEEVDEKECLAVADAVDTRSVKVRSHFDVK